MTSVQGVSRSKAPAPEGKTYLLQFASHKIISICLSQHNLSTHASPLLTALLHPKAGGTHHTCPVEPLLGTPGMPASTHGHSKRSFCKILGRACAVDVHPSGISYVVPKRGSSCWWLLWGGSLPYTASGSSPKLPHYMLCMESWSLFA